ncbi:MAG TPA: cytochrome c oxidase assembly protein [Nitriliruptorales bacterium]|nr:cytochrome c oxidase assembly protein [Nitriliruptorales bacterium]
MIAVVGLLAAGYVYAVRRWGRLFHPAAGDPPATVRQRVLFGLGLLSFWLALGWPVHDLGEDYLYAAHMVQHLILGFVTPPLLLLGTPEWLGRLLVGRGTVGATYRTLARPLIAAAIFNATLALIHWPAVVDLMVTSAPAHAALHWVFLVGALLMWSVLYSPLPEVRGRLAAPARMLFLFVQTILPTVPASFLTFGERTLYRFYETTPRLWGLSPRDDMQLAGLIMKLGGGLLLWSVIAVMFFRWASSEEPGPAASELRASGSDAPAGPSPGWS